MTCCWIFAALCSTMLLISSSKVAALRPTDSSSYATHRDSLRHHGVVVEAPPPNGSGAEKLADLLTAALIQKNITLMGSYLSPEFEAYVGGWAENFGPKYSNCPGKMNKAAYLQFAQHQMDTTGLMVKQPTLEFKSYLSAAMQAEFIFFNQGGTVAVTAPKMFYLVTVDPTETYITYFMELAPFTNQANSAQVVSLWNTLANSVAAKSISQLSATLSEDFIDIRLPQDANTSFPSLNKSATVSAEKEQMQSTSYGQVVTTSVFPACDYVWQAWLEPLTSTIGGKQTIIRGLSVLKVEGSSSSSIMDASTQSLRFSEWIEFGEYVKNEDLNE